jgi:hypothetical protein
MSHKDNYGPGGFSDQYDNNRMRSMDRDQHPGGVTGVPFEDDMDLNDMDFSPDHGEAYYSTRDADTERRPLDGDYFYGVGPKGWKLSDKKIYEKVCDVLLHSQEVDASEIEVKVQEGVVNLTGNISSKGMKRVAEDLVESIPGVVDVFTSLKIQNTSNFQFK